MTTPTADRRLVRAINRASVLRTVKEAGQVSRAGIARATGLSQVTVGSIVTDLIQRHLLVEGDEAPSGGGRPSRQLLLNASAYVAAGFKLTEEQLVGALTDLEANVLVEVQAPLDATSPDAIVALTSRLVDDLLERAGFERRRLLGVGLGMAGVVDGDGVCRYSPFLDWHDVPLGDLLEDDLGVPVLVDNDVNTLAMAERWFGAGQGETEFLLVTVGRGIGLAAITHGTLHRGGGGAGEFGHTVVDGSDRPCSCGRAGCLEATVGEAGLLAAAREAAPVARRRLRDLAGLYRTAADEPAVQAVIDAAGRSLGRGIANLVNLFAPRLVIISGEGLDVSTALVDAAAAEAHTHVFPGLAGSFEIVTEPLPPSAWARGAASLVLGEIFETPTRSQLDLLSDLGEGLAS